jgi:fatty acid desaturase
MTSVQIRKDLMRESLSGGWFVVDDRYGAWITLRILGPFLASFALAPLLLAESPWFATLLYLLIGVYGYKISFILHDCSHGTLFTSKALNIWLGRFCGWLVGVNYDVFAATHILHHRYNGTTLDPQHGEVDGLENASRGRLLNHLLTPLLGLRTKDILFGYQGGYLKNAREEELAVAARSFAVGRETKWLWLSGTLAAQIALALLVTGFAEIPWAALIYPLAATTLSLFLARLRTVAEHVREDASEGWEFSRTHLPNFLDSLILYDAHFNYHFEHHLFPHMPSSRLGSLFETFGCDYHSERTLGCSMLGTLAGRVRRAPT